MGDEAGTAGVPRTAAKQKSPACLRPGRPGSVNDGSRGGNFGSEGKKALLASRCACYARKPSSVETVQSVSPLRRELGSRGLSYLTLGKDVDLFEAVGVQAMPTFDTRGPSWKQRPIDRVSKWDGMTTSVI